MTANRRVIASAAKHRASTATNYDEIASALRAAQ
jgi:hypothetical protein